MPLTNAQIKAKAKEQSAKRGKRGVSPTDSAETNALELWAALMVEWAKDVRDDIVRLEAAMGMPPGDPGDPPSWPPE